MVDKKETRNFVIEQSDAGKTGGVFKGKRPGDAAKKAGRALFDSYTGQKRTISFQLREKGTDVVSHYQCTIKKLDVPKVIVRNGKEIKITREIRCKWLARTKPNCEPTLYTPSPRKSPKVKA